VNIPTALQLGKARRQCSLVKGQQKLTPLWEWFDAMSIILWYKSLTTKKCWHFSALTVFTNQHTFSKHTHQKKREKKENQKNILTICCHANKDTFFEATFLALISCYFVYHTFSFIFTGIGWMEVFLNGSSKKTLKCSKQIHWKASALRIFFKLGATLVW